VAENSNKNYIQRGAFIRGFSIIVIVLYHGNKPREVFTE
jgi:hypothetical protein